MPDASYNRVGQISFINSEFLKYMVLFSLRKFHNFYRIKVKYNILHIIMYQEPMIYFLILRGKFVSHEQCEVIRENKIGTVC